MSQWVHLLTLETFQWDHHPILVWGDKVQAWAMVVQAQGILVWEDQVQAILEWEVQAQDTQEWEVQVLDTLEWEAPALDTLEWEAPALDIQEWEAQALVIQEWEAQALVIQGWEAQALVIQGWEAQALVIQEWEAPALSPCLQKRSTHLTSRWFSILRIPTLPPSILVVYATKKSMTMTRQSSVNLGATSGFTVSAQV